MTLIFKTPPLESIVVSCNFSKIQTKAGEKGSLYVSPKPFFLIKSPLLFSAYPQNDFSFLPQPNVSVTKQIRGHRPRS